MVFGISQFRSAYRKGELTPAQAIATQLEYARSVAASVNAISVFSDSAVQEAEMSTRRYMSHNPIGPLDGVPVVVKDSYCVEGMPRWHGSAIHDGDPVSAGSSEPVMRLRQAGAIIIAKTTMPDMGMLGSGISSQFGIVRNPWDTSKSPGGSSAGTGAALAAGLAAFGLGTDIAGSVRLPAGHCGLAAIKPTQGRIAYSPASTMRSAGVMGRSVSDVIEGLSVIGREASTDPMCLPGAFSPTSIESVFQRMPTVGLLLDMGYGLQVQSSVRQAVEDAARRLTDAGFIVEPMSLGLTDADFADADRVFKAHAASEVRASRHPDRVVEHVKTWLQDAQKISMMDYDDALAGLLNTVRRIEHATRQCDFLISPVIPVPGFSADSPGPGDEQRLLRHTQFTAWFNQTGQPAAVYRECHDETSGLPIGVQIIGRRFDDAGVLAVTQYLEQTRSKVPEYPVLQGGPQYAN
ncbi:amidase [Bifidobacterium sp.]|uniref:amidase n=1 Tax=Bifidobacterium sp. TaxID=41200 RepID=UPI0039ECADE3